MRVCAHHVIEHHAAAAVPDTQVSRAVYGADPLRVLRSSLWQHCCDIDCEANLMARSGMHDGVCPSAIHC